MVCNSSLRPLKRKIRGRNPSNRRGYVPVQHNHREDNVHPTPTVPITRVGPNVGGNRDIFRLADILLHRYTYRSLTKVSIPLSFFFLRM